MISPRMKSIAVGLLLFSLSAILINEYSKSASHVNIRHGQQLLQGNQTCYGVIFDAGSSSTKLSVYSWACRDMAILPQINPTSVLSAKASPGISTFAGNLTAIESYLSPLLEQVKTVVPSDIQATTPIMLGATAGMRLISLEDQQAILEQTNKFFTNSGFYFKGDSWNRVITGQEEGIFLWIATNYLQGAIKNNTDLNSANNKTVATIDLGGASTQISFKYQTPEYSNVYNYEVTLPENNDYSLYSISYLGYGNDQARNQAVLYSAQQNSTTIYTGCYPAGYTTTLNSQTVIGTSNTTDCVQSIYQLLNINRTKCAFPSPTECSINNTYQALIPNTTEIIAVSGFNTAVKSFGLPSTFSPDQLFGKAEQFCYKDFATIQALEPSNSYVSTKCFLGLYASLLLSQGYSLYNRIISSPDLIGGAEPAWSLGFLFNEVSNLKCDATDSACQNLQSIFRAFRL